jgi:flagellar assembly factor FliW
MTRTAQSLASAATYAPIDALPQISNEVVRFPHGLPGFESCRGFVLMTSDAFGPLQCLKSVAGPDTSFLVIDPRRVLPDYRCALTEVDRRRLGVTNEDTLLWLSLVTIELDGTITVNLRAPIVINPAQMLGHQVVPSQAVYPIRHVIAAGG